MSLISVPVRVPLALAIARELENVIVHAVDSSAEALSLAEENLQLLAQIEAHGSSFLKAIFMQRWTILLPGSFLALFPIRLSRRERVGKP